MSDEDKELLRCSLVAIVRGNDDLVEMVARGGLDGSYQMVAGLMTGRAILEHCTKQKQRFARILKELGIEPPAKRGDKDFSKCPYPSHANDCDCEGVGGDR